jgi:hypothetical protein
MGTFIMDVIMIMEFEKIDEEIEKASFKQRLKQTASTFDDLCNLGMYSENIVIQL